jgi:hypothetical protein
MSATPAPGSRRRTSSALQSRSMKGSTCSTASNVAPVSTGAICRLTVSTSGSSGTG